MQNKEKNKLDELMVITMEECGELTQACSKIYRWGIDDGNGEITNRQRLVTEAGDVMAMIDIMIEKGILTEEELNARIQVKKNKLTIWSNLYDK